MSLLFGTPRLPDEIAPGLLGNKVLKLNLPWRKRESWRGDRSTESSKKFRDFLVGWKKV